MIIVEKVNKNDDCNAEQYDEYWIEQGMCPQCKRDLVVESRFSEEAWGRPSESYKVKVCTYCNIEVGGYY